MLQLTQRKVYRIRIRNCNCKTIGKVEKSRKKTKKVLGLRGAIAAPRLLGLPGSAVSLESSPGENIFLAEFLGGAFGYGMHPQKWPILQG